MSWYLIFIHTFLSHTRANWTNERSILVGRSREHVVITSLTTPLFSPVI